MAEEEKRNIVLQVDLRTPREVAEFLDLLRFTLKAGGLGEDGFNGEGLNLRIGRRGEDETVIFKPLHDPTNHGSIQD